MIRWPNKRSAVICLWSAWILSWGIAYPASAGTLSIRIRTTLIVENHLLKGTVDIDNRGSEAAFRLQMEILFPSESVTFPEVPHLNANESKSFALDHHLASVKNGIYPLPIIVTFHDMNLYPFSALSCPTFAVGQEPKGKISYRSKPFTVAKEGAALFYLENSESLAKNLTATIILPREFASPEKDQRVRLGPEQRKTVSFKIINQHALPCATYPVFCVFQYDEQGLHHTFVCQVLGTVTEGKNWFYRTRWLWLAGGVALVLFMLAKGWFTRGPC